MDFTGTINIINYYITSPKITRMLPEFNTDGNLPEGLYKPTLVEFKDRFVINCADSKTRSPIYSGYMDYCNQMITFDIASTNWVNGSFTTQKQDPGDIDIVIHYDALKLNKLPNREDINDRFLDQLKAKSIFHCHTQTVPVYPKHNPRYVLTFVTYKKWKKWFSRDKYTKKPKGLIEFDLSDDHHKQDVIGDGGK
jgi:hypothetical protein